MVSAGNREKIIFLIDSAMTCLLIVNDDQRTHNVYCNTVWSHPLSDFDYAVVKDVNLCCVHTK